MATDKEKFIEEKVHILDRDFTMTSMLMGVPHTIVFVDEFDLDMIEKYGPAIENCDLFPEKTNVNFVKVREQVQYKCIHLGKRMWIYIRLWNRE